MLINTITYMRVNIITGRQFEKEKGQIAPNYYSYRALVPLG